MISGPEQLPPFFIKSVRHDEYALEIRGDFAGPASTAPWARCYLYVGEEGLVHCRILSIGEIGKDSVLQVWPEEAGRFRLANFREGQTYGYLAPLDGDRA